VLVLIKDCKKFTASNSFFRATKLARTYAFGVLRNFESATRDTHHLSGILNILEMAASLRPNFFPISRSVRPSDLSLLLCAANVLSREGGRRPSIIISIFQWVMGFADISRFPRQYVNKINKLIQILS
jgi:hypothetical protein